MSTARPPKLAFAHLPTPIQHNERLDALVGCEVWVKRDDMSAGPEAGNKIRKLEYLLADAVGQAATVIVTCGGVQSNHARATAICARQLGLASVLCLRTTDVAHEPLNTGNVLLDRLVGAELKLITPAQYRERAAVMAEVAAELEARGERPYVIPEGGSNALGSLGYVDAMAEVQRQQELGLCPQEFDAVVHACGSGGTAAGIALGAALYQVAPQVHAMAVCDDSAYFEEVIRGVAAQAQRLFPRASTLASLTVHDAYKGPAYAVPSAEQRHFIVQVARHTGLVLDPVYTGKALFGLSQLPAKPRRALFIHTGGLPGLLAQADDFRNELG